MQNVKDSHSDAIMPSKNDIVLLSDRISKGMKIKEINLKIKGRRIRLKSVSGC